MPRCSCRTPRLRGIFASVALAGLLVTAPASAERVPGTSVTLEPPAGFAPAKDFAGFKQGATASSIVVTELAGPASEVTAAMTADGLSTQGMRLLASSETTVGSRSGLLLHVAEFKSGIEFEKWMLALGERNRTLLVVGTFPKELGDSLREPIRSALLSVRWSPRIEAPRTQGLPFAVSETAELKISQRVSSRLLLTKQGAKVTLDPADPLIVVGTAFNDIAITDVENFARDRVQRTSEISGVSGIEGESLRVDGLAAYELRADARDQKTGAPLRVYQLLVADGTRYFLAQGRVGAAQGDRFLPQFRQVGRSLRRVR